MYDPNNPYASPSASIDTHGHYAQSATSGGFQSAQTLALIVCVLLGANAVLDGFYVIVSVMEYNLYEQGFNFEGETLNQQELTVALAMMGLGLLQLLVYLITVVLFCIWNYRAYKNLQTLGVYRLQHSPGWAAGAWFVPILNLFRPYHIMQETWKGSDPNNLRAEGELYRRPEGSYLVGWWWAAWIIGGIVTQFAFRLNWNANGNVDMLQASAVASIVGSVITAICAIMAIQIVRGINANQIERHRQLTRQSGAITPY